MGAFFWKMAVYQVGIMLSHSSSPMEKNNVNYWKDISGGEGVWNIWWLFYCYGKWGVELRLSYDPLNIIWAPIKRNNFILTSLTQWLSVLNVLIWKNDHISCSQINVKIPHNYSFLFNFHPLTIPSLNSEDDAVAAFAGVRISIVLLSHTFFVGNSIKCTLVIKKIFKGYYLTLVALSCQKFVNPWGEGGRSAPLIIFFFYLEWKLFIFQNFP